MVLPGDCRSGCGPGGAVAAEWGRAVWASWYEHSRQPRFASAKRPVVGAKTRTPPRDSLVSPVVGLHRPDAFQVLRQG